ncbi:MAG TPA: hypothetical protein VE987_08175 [Polyangiaceae bacterium]|nr:hypothetical protein [Polyangiaceae bacterium]
MPDESAAPIAPPAAPPGPTLLMGPDGDVYRFDDPTRALAAGYRPLTHAELVAHEVEKEESAKGALGSIEEAAKSAGNQLLLGVPGAIADATATPEEREKSAAREEYHKTARLLGGAAGLGASLLFGGEVFRGAELAGQAAEHAILPAAEIAEASLGRRLAATAANYATQGAALAAPQAVIQAAWGDPKQAAETLLWGVGAGAALGGAGELLQAGGEAALEEVRSALGSDKAREVLSKFASDRTAKAFGAERSQLNKLSPERIREVTDFAHAEGIIRPGMSRTELGAAVDAAHEKYGGEIGDVLSSLDERVQRGTATEDLVGHAIKPGEIGDKIRAALDGPELRMPMNADQARALDQVVESAHLIPTTKVNGQEVISFEDAQNFVSSLRKRWTASIGRDLNEGGVRGLDVVTPLDQMKSAAYQVARDAVHGAGDRVALAAGDPSLVGALARAKASYSKVAELDKWAATLERQQAGNRMIGLTDFIHMGQGPVASSAQAVGAGLGGLLGGAPGAVAGAMIGKVPGAVLDLVAKHWMEDKGLVYLSALSKRAAREGPEMLSAVMASEGAKRLAATMTGVQDTVRRLAMRGIEEVSARKTEHMKALLGSTSGLTPDQAYSKLGARLTQLASSPAAMTTVVGHLSAPFASSAPAVADAYSQKLGQAIQYLYAALPKAPAPPAPFAPQSWSPSATDKLAFHDRAEIVANPMAAMQHVAQGTLSDAHLDALRTIYPMVYAMMQKEVLDFAASHPEVKLPLPERQSVARLLGTSLDTLDTPERVQQLQAAYTLPPAAPPGAKMPKGKLKKVADYGTSFSATMGRPAA